MFTLLDYIHARHLTKEAFVAEQWPGYWVCDPDPDCFEGAAGPLSTLVASGAELRRQQDGLMDVDSDAERLVVIPIAGTHAQSVGRARSCDIVLANRCVSKLQGFIDYSPDRGFVLRDAGSKNGTWVNGHRLGAGERVVLQPGDRVRFPPFELRLWSAAQLHDEIDRRLEKVSPTNH